MGHATLSLADSGMGVLEMIASVTELAASRKAILNSFVDTDDEATDLKNMERLTEIENRLENATYEIGTDKSLGRSILMECHPSGWDNFQQNLFLRMQQFA